MVGTDLSSEALLDVEKNNELIFVSIDYIINMALNEKMHYKDYIVYDVRAFNNKIFPSSHRHICTYSNHLFLP